LPAVVTTEISFSLPRGVQLRELPVGIGAPDADGSGQVRVHTDDPVSALLSLTRWALDHDHDLPDLEVRRPRFRQTPATAEA
jgi:hypothetical protein